MKRLLERYYAWTMNRERKRFEKLLMNPKSGIGVLLQNRSTEMALAMVIRWLENKRIRHCAICPGTDTLRRIEDKFWCPTHFDAALTATANRKKEVSKKEATATI